MRFLIAFLALAIPAAAMQRGNGFCETGGVTTYSSANTSIPNTPQVQGSSPGCTVSVFFAGTTTLAPIFSDNGITPQANPFLGDATTGQWYFYAANGAYDVQLSGSVTNPYITRVNLFDVSNYQPNNVLAYPSGGVPGIVGIYDATTTFIDGFTAPLGLAQTNIWKLPLVDANGCLESNGSYQTSWVAGNCFPGGGTNSLQYNVAGQFTGDGNLTWNPTTRLETIAGSSGANALLIPAGNAQIVGTVTAGGVITTANAYNGVGSATDGAAMSGYQVNQNGATGGSVHLKPLTYSPGTCIDKYGNPVTQPAPMLGETFGANDLYVWNGTSPSVGGIIGATGPGCPTALPVNGIYGLNTNGYWFARAGFATDSQYYNSFTSFLGGYSGQSFTAGGFYPAGTVTTTGTLGSATYLGGYMQMGHSSGPPVNGCTSIASCPNPLTLGDGVEQGTFYWDDALACVNVYNGSAWACVGSGGGGGGSPGGINTEIQVNASGSFAGYPDLTYNSSTDVLRIGAISGIGYVLTPAGFATTGTSYLAGNFVDGGVQAKSLFALNYIQTGTSSGPPALTSGQSSFVAGALYWDTGSAAEQVYNGSSWTSLGGGTGSPGGGNFAVQFNSTGSFGGDAHLTYDYATFQLNLAGGFMQSDVGFLAQNFSVSTTPMPYNSIQVPTGGMYALSMNAKNYINSGTSGAGGGPPPITLDGGFTYGSMYFDQVANCEEVYSGTSWSCLGTGGSGTPGGPPGAVQFSNTAGTGFAGSGNWLYNNTTQAMAIIASVGSPQAISVSGGYIEADTGFDAPLGTAYNTIQAPVGGVDALSVFATNYTQLGSFHGGSPSVVTPPTRPSGATVYLPGAAFWNLDTGCLEVNSATSSSGTWSCAGGGGGGTTVNGVSGAVILAGTAHEIIIPAPVGQTITLTTPQPIDTTSNVAFATVGATTFTATGGGVDVLGTTAANSIQTAGGITSAIGVAVTNSSAPFNSFTTTGGLALGTGGAVTATLNMGNGSVYAGSIITANGGTHTGTASGSTNTFQNSNGNFQVNGNGALSITGVFASTGASGGLSIANSAFNSIQTVGGINVGTTGLSTGNINVDNVTVVDNVTPGSPAGHFLGGISTGTPGGAHGSTVYIGPNSAGGSFYAYNFSSPGSSGLSCATVQNGWTGYNLYNNQEYTCNGGIAYYTQTGTPSGGYSFAGGVGGTTALPTCSATPSAGQAQVGTLVYCVDCKNAQTDSAVFDANATGPSGHGTNVLCEGSSSPTWRVH